MTKDANNLNGAQELFEIEFSIMLSRKVFYFKDVKNEFS